MAVLHTSHPDIEAFIQAKQIDGRLCNFNLSVAADDLFIDCALSGKDYPLIHPRTGVQVGQTSAIKLLEMISAAAWTTGDPGMLFIDRINADNPTPGMGRLEATNPCGEQPLLPYECCTLTTVAPTGTINLVAGVSSGIEPVYAFETRRCVTDKVFDEVHPIYERFRREGRTIDKAVFQSAYDVASEWHLKIQAAFQKHTDNAVSKTVNLSSTASQEDIKQLFLAAMQMPVRGITVYRGQSHREQILSACSINREECS